MGSELFFLEDIVMFRVIGQGQGATTSQIKLGPRPMNWGHQDPHGLSDLLPFRVGPALVGVLLKSKQNAQFSDFQDENQRIFVF